MPDDHALARALAAGVINEEDTAVIVYDFDDLDARITQLQSAFPNALNAAAIKACPLRGVLRQYVEAGLGLEAASLPEVHLAEHAGCANADIVFDSPAKTEAELRYAIDLGVTINIDNWSELERVSKLAPEKSDARFGLRVNPQLPPGTIEATSVATTRSKFGVAIADRSRIVDAFARYAWLTGLHLHLGSQGFSIDRLVNAIASVLELANDIPQLKWFDIGGGLPFDASFDEYRTQLAFGCPGLFDGSLQLITEFGRAIVSQSGWAATRIEHIKPTEGGPILVTHLGADFLLRECYQPGTWGHALEVVTPEGKCRSGEHRRFDVAGPLCFAGDMPFRDVALPTCEAGDWLVIRDTGAYTLSMWSRYNSRCLPKVLRQFAGKFDVLRQRETEQQVLQFWEG